MNDDEKFESIAKMHDDTTSSPDPPTSQEPY